MNHPLELDLSDLSEVMSAAKETLTLEFNNQQVMVTYSLN